MKIIILCSFLCFAKLVCSQEMGGLGGASATMETPRANSLDTAATSKANPNLLEKITQPLSLTFFKNLQTKSNFKHKVSLVIDFPVKVKHWFYWQMGVLYVGFDTKINGINLHNNYSKFVTITREKGSKLILSLRFNKPINQESLSLERVNNHSVISFDFEDLYESISAPKKDLFYEKINISKQALCVFNQSGRAHIIATHPLDFYHRPDKIFKQEDCYIYIFYNTTAGVENNYNNWQIKLYAGQQILPNLNNIYVNNRLFNNKILVKHMKSFTAYHTNNKIIKFINPLNYNTYLCVLSLGYKNNFHLYKYLDHMDLPTQIGAVKLLFDDFVIEDGFFYNPRAKNLKYERLLDKLYDLKYYDNLNLDALEALNIKLKNCSLRDVNTIIKKCLVLFNKYKIRELIDLIEYCYKAYPFIKNNLIIKMFLSWAYLLKPDLKNAARLINANSLDMYNRDLQIILYNLVFASQNRLPTINFLPYALHTHRGWQNLPQYTIRHLALYFAQLMFDAKNYDLMREFLILVKKSGNHIEFTKDVKIKYKFLKAYTDVLNKGEISALVKLEKLTKYKKPYILLEIYKIKLLYKMLSPKEYIEKINKILHQGYILPTETSFLLAKQYMESKNLLKGLDILKKLVDDNYNNLQFSNYFATSVVKLILHMNRENMVVYAAKFSELIINKDYPIDKLQLVEVYKTLRKFFLTDVANGLLNKFKFKVLDEPQKKPENTANLPQFKLDKVPSYDANFVKSLEKNLDSFIDGNKKNMEL